MNNQLVKDSQKTLKVLNQFFDKDDVWNQILVRDCTCDNNDLFQLQTFDKDKLQAIAEYMPEIDRATRSLGRKNTQTTNKLMTLTMLSGASPYRVLRQCLAQIEKSRGALKETRIKLRKDIVTLAANVKKVTFYQKQLESFELEGLSEIDTEEKVELLKIDIEDKRTQISDSVLYIEGALKDIASFQTSYRQVCKNKDIPMDWDEEDLEQFEVIHHVKMGFLLAYRDIKAHGSLGMGTLEYTHQFGTIPDTVEKEVRLFLNNIFSQDGDYLALEGWLEQMSLKYKDNYLNVLKHLGLDQLYNQNSMYIEKDK